LSALILYDVLILKALVDELVPELCTSSIDVGVDQSPILSLLFMLTYPDVTPRACEVELVPVTRSLFNIFVISQLIVVSSIYKNFKFNNRQKSYKSFFIIIIN
jgi:hypothetical protein